MKKLTKFLIITFTIIIILILIFFIFSSIQNYLHVRKISKSLVFVYSERDVDGGYIENKQATGFVISEQGHIITAYHTIVPSDRIFVYFAGSSGIPYPPQGYFAKKKEIPTNAEDLAIIKIDHSEKKLIPLNLIEDYSLLDVNANLAVYGFLGELQKFYRHSSISPPIIKVYIHTLEGIKTITPLSDHILMEVPFREKANGLSGGPIIDLDRDIVIGGLYYSTESEIAFTFIDDVNLFLEYWGEGKEYNTTTEIWE